MIKGVYEDQPLVITQWPLSRLVHMWRSMDNSIRWWRDGLLSGEQSMLLFSVPTMTISSIFSLGAENQHHLVQRVQVWIEGDLMAIFYRSDHTNTAFVWNGIGQIGTLWCTNEWPVWVEIRSLVVRVIYSQSQGHGFDSCTGNASCSCVKHITFPLVQSIRL